MSTVTYNFDGFTQVHAENAVWVSITRSDIYSVSATAEDVKHVKVEKAADTLTVGRRFPGLLGLFHDRPRINITMPDLKELRLSGSVQGAIRGFRVDHTINLRLSGASHLELADLTCQDLSVQISGASNLVGNVTVSGNQELAITGASRAELSGSGLNAKIELSGASQARLAALDLTDVAATVSGASHARLRMTGRLNADLSGASTLEYSGTPLLGDVRTTGASTLTRK